MTLEQIKVFLKALQEAGISLYVAMPTGGCMDIDDPAQIEQLMKNQNIFWAMVYECEVNQFTAWLEARTGDGVQCCHVNFRKKKRCRNWAPAGEHPGLFSADGMKCEFHSKLEQDKQGE